MATKNKTLNEQLADERERGAKLRAEHAAVKRAPLARDEALQRVDELVRYLRGTIDLAVHRIVAPNRSPVGDRLAIPGPRIRPELVTDGLLCMLHPERVREAFVERLDAHYAEHKPGLPQAERTERLAELAAKILASERREENLVRQLEAQGLDVDRRPDADVAVLLDAEFGREAA